MNFNRFGTALTVLATGALMLSACSSDNASEGSCGGKEALQASGSSAQKNAMDSFVAAYQKKCPQHRVDYTASGSGAGVKEFVGNQTDFGGTDVALSDEEAAKAKDRCGGAPAWNLPVVFGPIAVTYNLEGIEKLVLDGPTAAMIFNGAITHWNDPAIAKLNAGISLPNEDIHVIYRSDESGTTDNFQKYLDGASDGAWGKGAGKAFQGGVGEGKKGNDGTAAFVKSNPGSISYNEWSFAQNEKLGIAQIVTSASSEPVAISTDSVGKTINGAKFKHEGSNDLALDTTSFYKPTQPGAYPIVLATYEVVCSKYPDASVGTAVKTFLQVAIGAGQDGLDQIGYIPIPTEFKSRLSTAVDAIS